MRAVIEWDAKAAAVFCRDHDYPHAESLGPLDDGAALALRFEVSNGSGSSVAGYAWLHLVSEKVVTGHLCIDPKFKGRWSRRALADVMAMGRLMGATTFAVFSPPPHIRDFLSRAWGFWYDAGNDACIRAL